MPLPAFAMNESRTSSKRASSRLLLTLLPSLVATTAVGLVACGGGGSDSSGGDAAAVAAPVKIDSTNYKAASSAVVEGGFGIADVDLSGIGSVVDTAGNASNKTSAARTAVSTLEAFDTLRRSKGGMWSGTTNSSLNCSGGGTMTIDASFTRPGTNSTGDRFAITYDNCIDLNGRLETDGRIELVLSHVGLGDFLVDPAYEVRLTYSFTQLRSIDSTGTTVTDGSMEIESVRTAIRQGYDGVAVPRLETSFTPLVAGPRTWAAIHAYAARNTYTPQTTTTTIDGTMSGSDGLNEGSVTVDTTTPFVRAIGHYPHVGVLTATGDQRSRLEVRAIDDATVRLSVDANGDGTYEQVEDVAWVSIW